MSGGDLGTIRLANQGGRLMLYGDDQRIIDHVTWSKRDVDRLGEGCEACSQGFLAGSGSGSFLAGERTAVCTNALPRWLRIE